MSTPKLYWYSHRKTFKYTFGDNLFSMWMYPREKVDNFLNKTINLHVLNYFDCWRQEDQSLVEMGYHPKSKGLYKNREENPEEEVSTKRPADLIKRRRKNSSNRLTYLVNN